MNKLFAYFLTGFSFIMTSGMMAPQPLETYRWEHRIILVAAPADQAEDLVAELQQARAEILARHILWFVIDEESITSNDDEVPSRAFRTAVLNRYFKDNSTIQVRLIGKDGGLKEKADTLDLTRLFARIDAMPMRQAEMRRE